MYTNDKIFELLKAHNISQKNLANYLNIAQSIISEWKHGKKLSYKDYINDIADLLEISPDIFVHELRRDAAVEKFGFCMNAAERNEVKTSVRNKRQLEKLSKSELVETFILEFKSLFSRSLENCNFNGNHVSFDDYVAMLLNQEQWRDKCQAYGEEVYDILVSRFGTKEGIPKGSYYDIPQRKKSVEKGNIIITNSEKLRRIPLFESVSAGYGTYADSHVIGYEAAYIESDYEAENTIAIIVKGDSMYPKIEDGDIIQVLKQDYFENGNIVVAIPLDGTDSGYVKRAFLTKGRLTLESINPSYPPMIFKNEEMNDIRIVGVVKKIIKNCD